MVDDVSATNNDYNWIPDLQASLEDGLNCFLVNRLRRPVFKGWRTWNQHPLSARFDVINAELDGQKYTEDKDFRVLGYAFNPGLDEFVVDIDIKKDKNGWKHWERLLVGLNLSTADYPPHVTTPSGGFHIYFKAPANVKRSLRSYATPEGIDIRANNGFVVASPSPGYVGIQPYQIPWHECPKELYEALLDLAPKRFPYDNDDLAADLSAAEEAYPILKVLARLELTPDINVDEVNADGWTDNFSCLNPHHEDKISSAGLNPAAGVYHCFACEWSGRSGLLIAKVMGLSLADGYRLHDQWAGITRSASDDVASKVANKKEMDRIMEMIDGLFHDDYFPINEVIYELANRSLVNPLGLLLAVLTHASAMNGIDFRLPPLAGVGGSSPLSLYTTLVGKPATGKTQTIKILKKHFRFDKIEGPHDGVVVTKNKGKKNEEQVELQFEEIKFTRIDNSQALIRLFNDRVAQLNFQQDIQVRYGASISYDEAASLLAAKKSTKYAIGAMLRTAWSGGALTSRGTGDQYKYHTAEDAYSLGVIANSHPEASTYELISTDGEIGDGDRWLAAPVKPLLKEKPSFTNQVFPLIRIKRWAKDEQVFIDSDIEEAILENVELAQRFGYVGIPVHPKWTIQEYSQYIELDEIVQEEVIDHYIAIITEKESVGRYQSSHSKLLQLRVAALLALVNRHAPKIEYKHWAKADQIVKITERMRALSHQQWKTSRANPLNQRINREFYIKEEMSKREMGRTVEGVVNRAIEAFLKKLKKAPAKGMTWAVAYNKFSPKIKENWEDLDFSIEELQTKVISHCLREGLVVDRGTNNRGNALFSLVEEDSNES